LRFLLRMVCITPPKRELKRERSHGETDFEFAADSPSFRPSWPSFRGLARAAGALMPAAPAKSFCSCGARPGVCVDRHQRLHQVLAGGVNAMVAGYKSPGQNIHHAWLFRFGV
jgi:hypothetical protein